MLLWLCWFNCKGGMCRSCGPAIMENSKVTAWHKGYTLCHLWGEGMWWQATFNPLITIRYPGFFFLCSKKFSIFTYSKTWVGLLVYINRPCHDLFAHVQTVMSCSVSFTWQNYVVKLTKAVKPKNGKQAIDNDHSNTN